MEKTLNTVLFGAWKMFRGLLFIVLLTIRPLLRLVLGGIAGIGAFGVVGVLLLGPTKTPAFFIGTVAVISMGLLFLVEWMVMLLAPEGFIMTLD